MVLTTTSRDSDSPLRGLWDNVFVFSGLMLAVALLLSYLMIRSAFSDQFNCDYLLVEQVSAPDFTCDGADLGESTGLSGAVDDVADFLGLGDSDAGSAVGDALSIPGLADLIDGPLGVIRRIGVVVGLLLLAAFSAWVTWVVRHVRHIVRLLQLDREAWLRTATTARTFLTVFVGLLTPIAVVTLL